MLEEAYWEGQKCYRILNYHNCKTKNTKHCLKSLRGPASRQRKEVLSPILRMTDGSNREQGRDLTGLGTESVEINWQKSNTKNCKAIPLPYSLYASNCPWGSFCICTAYVDAIKEDELWQQEKEKFTQPTTTSSILLQTLYHLSRMTCYF